MYSDDENNFFSFIVVAKNEEKYISKCLDSINDLGIPSENYEIVLIDNGSEDSTVTIAKQNGALVFVEPLLKVSGMRNYGANISSGNILVFLDADVVINFDWFSVLKKHVLEGKFDCVFAPESWYGNPTLVERCWLQVKGLGDDNVRQVKWCQSGAFMIKRSVFENVGGFNESLATSEDYDFGVRLSNRFTILRDGSVCFFHMRTPKTIKDLFWQQVWHGKDSFKAFWNQKFNFHEFIGTFLPPVFLFSILFSFAFLFCSKLLANCFFVIAILIYFVYLKYKIKKIDKYFPVHSFLIIIFIVARGLSPFIKGRRLSQ